MQNILLTYKKRRYSLTSLRITFYQMGMTDMFTSKADFSGLLKSQKNDAPLYVSNIIHKTVIEVDEDGTDAYSATGTNQIVSILQQDKVNAIFSFTSSSSYSNVICGKRGSRILR